MSRIIILLFGIWSLASMSFAQQRPNILLIVSDDHGKEAIGAYGNPVIKTPAMDRLAAEGIKFNNAFCTSASCSASRSVILTGKFGHATGHYGHEHAYHHFSTFDGVKSLPVMLEASGYRTARVGKYHLAPEKVYHFQHVLPSNCRNPVEMAEASNSFMSNSDDPFFLYYCPCDPHRSHDNANDKPFKPNLFGNKKNGYKGVTTQSYKPEEVIVPGFLPDTEATRQELAQYYESVSRVDQGLETLIRQLKESGKYDNTLIIYISDNGVAFPGAKTTLYEPGMRLPMLVKMPKQEGKGSERNQLVSWADLTPTLLEIATGQIPDEGFQGHSFTEVLHNPNTKGQPEIYAAHNFHEVTMYYPMRVIRTDRYKLIYNIAHPLQYPFASDLWASATWQYVMNQGMEQYGKRAVETYLHHPKLELYDLKNDPDETINLVDSPQHQETLNAMTEKLIKFQKTTGDPWVYKWEFE
ncbi:sulfatase [Limibacter armeniacum]|uniref:sulfatase family protein n=1 Tax=Limibacter armeniacum TaxID=466084 RepID=UPI002FE671FB